MSVCATCLKPGLPADGKHDCPGLGDIQLTRQLGRGIRVDTAPPRARMALTVLADRGHGLAMQGDDLINIADQVLYQVVGYDPESAALVLELVEDWRPGSAPGEDDEEPVGPAKPGIPRCTATWETEHQGTAHCWRAATHNQREGYETHMGEAEHGYRFQWIGTEPGATPHRVDPPLNYKCAACRAHAIGTPGAHDNLSCACRDEMCEGCLSVVADATACTPIPDATLRQMSEAPPELRQSSAPPGFVPFVPEHIPRRETTDDPLAVEPYRNDRNQDRWAFRCWGTATCDGWLSLDHTSQQWAEHARDRHVAEEHTKEQPMSTCTATIEGPHVLGGGPVHCTREAGHPENHVGLARDGDGKVLWTDHHAGAVPHGAPAAEES